MLSDLHLIAISISLPNFDQYPPCFFATKRTISTGLSLVLNFRYVCAWFNFWIYKN